MIKKFIAVLIFISGTSFSQAQNNITIENIYTMPSVNSPVLSPKGDKLIYITNEPGKSNPQSIILLDLNTQKSETILNTGSDPQWSPDGQKIALRANLNGKSGIHVLNLNDKSTKFIAQINNSNHFLGHSANKNYAWSPDGKSIAFVSADLNSAPNVDPLAPKIIERILYKSRTSFSDNRLTRIYVVNIENGEIKTLTQDKYDSHSLTWSPDSKKIAYISNHTADPDANYNNDIFIVDIATSKIEQITKTPGTEHNPNWSPDGKYILYPATVRLRNTKDSSGEDMKLYTYEVATGKITCLTQNLDERLDGAKWTNDSKSYYFGFPKNGKRVLYKGTLNSEIITPIVDENASVGRPTTGGNKMAFTKSTPSQPNEIFLTANEGKTLTQITQLSTNWLKDKTLSKNEDFWFQSHDGVKVHGFIAYPANVAKSAKIPVIHRIHGGPHGAFGFSYTDINEILVAQGYAVISLNPRGSSGYGQKFTDGTYQAWGGGDYLDLMAGIDYALEKYPFLDANRMGVTGGSYGGFMTNWVVTQTNRYKAAVTSASVSNLISFYGTSIYPDLIETEFNGMPWDNYSLLWHFSPMAHIKNVKTPTLIIHGENDMDVPITQAEEFFIGLKKLGVPTKFIRYPNEGHGFTQQKNRLHNNQQLLAWFNQYLK